ncbi:T9SS type A sorting domain-containing protein [Cytophagales bacterium LB-30]|uniref:T9SS type A sorting domain-containing protein n=1 Tax=Shiella aurantiaca TaxID=3058365 RepID=A0ABT8F1W0_9BACT|nr:T9SS type A sorting domain-containing protein [Shiella aurantiaca]MDN4164231.1 T9SS type A sorting domain-containing protein [Shiella aurantiaca]
MKRSLFSIFFLLASWAQAQFITNTGISLHSTTELRTNGDWGNQGYFLNNGVLITNQPYTQSDGGLDGASIGGFILSYTSDQIFAPGGSSYGFLMKDGAGRLTLVGTQQIKDSLLVSGSGIFTSDTLILGRGIKLMLDAGQFVEGTLARQDTGTVHFPIGLAGEYLPITFYQARSEQITVQVQTAPSDLAAGPNVYQLIDFPYAWKSSKAAPTDTARYVEVEFPSALLADFENPQIIRQRIGLLAYRGLGASEVMEANGRTRVKSYRRGLQGLYSIGLGYPGNRMTDSLTLVKLYQSTNGSNWTQKSNWLTNPLDTWHGIQLENNRVVKVELSNNQLAGVLPSDLSTLSELRKLDLTINQITGEIPGSLGNFFKLDTLYMYANRLYGSLPDSLGSLESLVAIDFGGNQLTGPIPLSYYELVSLKRLGFAGNRLSGNLQPAIGNLSNLEVLYLDNNQLTGTLPTEIGNLTQLRQLYIQRNKLTGGVPSSLATLNNLQAMGLEENDFTELPDLSNQSWTYLNVSRNQFDFGDIEPNASISGISYVPQKPLGIASRDYLQVGDSLAIGYAVGGTANAYQWYKDGVLLDTETADSLIIRNVDFANQGVYRLEIKNFIVPDLTLNTAGNDLRISSLVRDSLALLALYNATDGPNWTNSWNINQNLNTWAGVTINNNRVTALSLVNRNLVGKVPGDLTDIRNITSVNLSENQLDSIPDFSGIPTLASLNVSSNRLEYDDIVPNLGVSSFLFDNQAKFGEAATFVESVGRNITLSVSTPDLGNQYQWYGPDNVAINGATNSSYTIQSMNYAKMGDYYCLVTQPQVRDINATFALSSENQTALAKANISGLAKDLNGNLTEAGEVYLFRVQTGKYDTISFNTDPYVILESDGNYLMPDVILGDYVILVNPDEATYPELIPSYFKGTIDWEEANTFQHRYDSTGVDITVQGTPAPPQGNSELSGFFEEDIPDGRLLARSRLSGSGVSVRKDVGQNRGRWANFELAGYVKTDENGEFVFPNLEPGNYLIKFEYPGVPMDQTSDIAFTVEEYTEIELGATVIDGSIKVETLRVLGIPRAKQPALMMYPNPTDKEVSLFFAASLSGNVEVVLVDMAGKQVMTERKEVSNQKLQLDVSQLDAGLYIVKVISPSGQLVGQSRLSVK